MSSIIKVNTYQDANGNALFSSDGSGNVTTSATGLQNTPAFEAYLSSNQNLSNDTVTKILFDTEVFDSDGCYDNTTNYRFTPTVAGKYKLYTVIYYDSVTSGTEILINFDKNGSQVTQFKINTKDGVKSYYTSTIVTANGSTDYFEVDSRHNSGVTEPVVGNASIKFTYFGGYRLIGA